MGGFRDVAMGLPHEMDSHKTELITITHKFYAIHIALHSFQALHKLLNTGLLLMVAVPIFTLLFFPFSIHTRPWFLDFLIRISLLYFHRHNHSVPQVKYISHLIIAVHPSSSHPSIIPSLPLRPCHSHSSSPVPSLLTPFLASVIPVATLQTSPSSSPVYHLLTPCLFPNCCTPPESSLFQSVGAWRLSSCFSLD